MRCIPLLFAAWLVACLPVVAAEPPPPLPTEVRLTNGATLHRVSVVRWEKERVVLKHAGGADPVRYDHIAEADRGPFLARREGEVAAAERAKREARTARESANRITLRGQVFITTRGAGAYRFAGCTVSIYGIERAEFDNALNYRVRPPAPIASTITDADGRYTLSVPTGTQSWCLYARTERLVGDKWEVHTWLLGPESFPNLDNALLSGDNRWQPR